MKLAFQFETILSLTEKSIYSNTFFNVVTTRILFIVFLFILSLQACREASVERHNIFRYNQANGISSLDPAFSKDQATTWACNQLFDGLVRLNEKLELVPAIADSWAIDPLMKTYTFFLKRDVYFHRDTCFSQANRTRIVNAYDFQYSFERIIDPKIASPGSWIFNGRIDSMEPFKVIDSFTFQIKLQRPFYPFLNILSMQYCSVIPKEAIDWYKNEFNKHPVGTGPFRFKFMNEGIALFLSKNPLYFIKDSLGKALPYLDGVKVSFIDNKKTEYLTFLQNELDMISGIDISYLNELINKDGQLQQDKQGKIKMYTSPYLNTEYLGFLNESMLPAQSPLRNKNVRKAINYGINRKELIQYLKNNIGQSANSGFVPKGLSSFDESAVIGYQYQPDEARKLLQETKLDFKNLPPIVLHINSVNQDLAEFVAKQLEQIGLVVEVQLHPSEFLGQIVKDGKAEFFRRSWIADYADPETYLTCFYSKNGSPPNYTRFNNPAFDALYEQALMERENSKRIQIYQEMDKIILEEAPIVPLFYDQAIRFAHPNIENISPNAMNLLDLRMVKIVQ